MKKISSPSMTARATIGALFFVTGIFLIVFGLFTSRLHSAMPASGTLNPGGSQLNWVGTAVGGGSLDESTCVEGVNCDTFTVTYSGTANAVSTSAGSALAPSAPLDRGPKIGFQNFEAPGTLVQVTDSSQGPTLHTVEYTGHDAGEPSIGVNWNSPNSASGVTNFQ